ncbi:thioredoxin family protein [Paenibacillus sp. JX-17]|uniref:Thioredoxin family protein n=1 Tax=Paenibacillus lacisoli TaxID=3064525 RepID=A0ABT9CES9_9BACL|nr:thioredoxin family protein [Paenibacillus sp. JX-17]MDO7907073.1 thioredoxin family protein [Paenibacillus sp. JX-17]
MRSSMEKITHKEQFNAAIQAPGLTVAVFKADWCGDCRFIDPFMPDVETSYKDKLKLIEVDVEQAEGVSEEHNILGIPSFIAYSEGRELIRYVNKLRKTREEIEQFLDRAVEVYGAVSQ